MKKLSVLTALAGTLLALAVAGCGGDDTTSTANTSGTPQGADFDRAFIDAMVPHHESAIAMAEAANEAGLNQPDLVGVANAILKTQQLELNQMKDWRGEWFGSSMVDPKGADALGLDEHMMGMDGDPDALRNSMDVNTDFAQMMVSHHEGAIEMAKLADANAEHQEIKDLARAIIAAQEKEIAVMRAHASGAMNHG